MWCALQHCQALRTLRLWWRSEAAHFKGHRSLNLQPVSTLTQLQSLELNGLIDNTFICSGLSTLTALTSLVLWWPKFQLAPALGISNAEQQLQGQQQQQQQVQLANKRARKRQHGQALQLAISHTTHLNQLSFCGISVPAGIADTLAQLTGLTQLHMHKIEPDAAWYSEACHSPVVLPSVQQLVLYGQGALQFLAGTHLPLLTNLRLDIKLGAETGGMQAQLLRSRMSLLQHCHSFAIKGQGKEVDVDELGSLLTTLAAAATWQQPPPKGHTELFLTELPCPHQHCLSCLWG
jgi:hypothetical protein